MGFLKALLYPEVKPEPKSMDINFSNITGSAKFINDECLIWMQQTLFIMKKDGIDFNLTWLYQYITLDFNALHDKDQFIIFRDIMTAKPNSLYFNDLKAFMLTLAQRISYPVWKQYRTDFINNTLDIYPFIDRKLFEDLVTYCPIIIVKGVLMNHAKVLNLASPH